MLALDSLQGLEKGIFFSIGAAKCRGCHCCEIGFIAEFEHPDHMGEAAERVAQAGQRAGQYIVGLAGAGVAF